MFWKRGAGNRSNYFFLVVLAIISATEMIQVAFPDKFTFDWADLGAAIAGSVLSYIANKRLHEKKKI